MNRKGWQLFCVGLRQRPLILLGVLLAGFAVSGCSHYHLGTDTVLPFHTLYVEPITNKTLLPQAEAITSTSLRTELLRDGRVTLVNSPEEADATLSLTLVTYRREVATTKSGDTGLARKFTLTLGAVATLHDNRRGQNLFEQRALSVSRDSFTDSGQLQGEYQTLPLLADQLAQRAAHAALDVW